MKLYSDQGLVADLVTTGKSGGEGEIFRNSAKSDECAKIFHEAKITGELQESIRSMVRNPPVDPTLSKFINNLFLYSPLLHYSTRMHRRLSIDLVI